MESFLKRIPEPCPGHKRIGIWADLLADTRNDTLRTELHVLPEEARVRTSDILEDVLDDLCDQRRECCEALYEVLRGTGAGAVEPLKEEERA